MTNVRKDKGALPTGVSLNKENGKYEAKISIDSKQKLIGRYTTVEEAHKQYCNARNEYARELGKRYRVASCR
ncbi:TPA: hypothetical protein KNH97_003152 [Clostridioides difficile]|uniref:hypothetical protein n=1 Tax=Clostridioides difficile TaxID=1496 RepID=UPI001C1C94D4|nr:hypothetical protein [Clostridioides difficile]HBE9438116.1 hypothetical protein [Clostridioides difficile]HBF4772542.1 hypothetical protein [Clostridioides difficile]